MATVACANCWTNHEVKAFDLDEFDSFECWKCDSTIYVGRGMAASLNDPSGAYTPDGRRIGRTGGMCEDAPCCGCCP